MPSHLILWMQIAKQGLPEGLIRFWGTLFVLRPFFDQSALEYLTDSNNQEVSDFKYPTYSDLIYQLKEADKKHKEHQEIVNGSSVRPFYKPPPPLHPSLQVPKTASIFQNEVTIFSGNSISLNFFPASLQWGKVRLIGLKWKSFVVFNWPMRIPNYQTNAILLYTLGKAPKKNDFF